MKINGIIIGAFTFGVYHHFTINRRIIELKKQLTQLEKVRGFLKKDN
jgi:hypothetical protein